MGGIVIDKVEIIESQLRQIFGTIVWTHKIQEKQADIYKSRYNWLECGRIIISALTSCGVFTILFVDDYLLKFITAIVSGISLFITSYFKSYDLKSLQKQHKKSALDFLELREYISSILCDIKMGMYSEEELIEIRNGINKMKLEISKTTPDAGNKAIKLASKCLNERKDNEFTDEEIDRFLPTLAKKNKE